MKNKLKVISLVIIINLFISKIYAETPIIVIAPSKKPQSISTVGSSVTVYTEEDIENSPEIFLQNILSYGSPGLSAYQSGGAGTIAGVQLRGLPKRYTTIYIDGIKMSDPSTVSNDYYFDDLMKSSVSRIEILRGNQSTMYGSGAMGGTINITTKKGKEGLQKKMSVNTGSNDAINISGSISGADEKKDFWLGYETFHTKNDSAMTDNNEQDSYHNDTIAGNFGYKLNDELKFETSSRFIYSFLNYDSLDSAFSANSDDNNQNWNKEWNGNLALKHNPNLKFNQSLNYTKSINYRTYDAFDEWGSAKAQTEYRGYRDGIYYSGNYNFNLDNSITYGAEVEFDQYDHQKTNTKFSNEIGSAYYDIQTRLTNNLYTTFGMRFDEHSEAGNEDSHRVSFAYLTDNKKTKFKGTYGTSYRFPSLYENYVVWNGDFDGKLTAETGKGHDIGIERSFLDSKLNLDLTYFNLKYNDTLDGWKDTATDGNSYYHNQDGLVKSEGFELAAKWLTNENLNFDLNYTATRTYDGADHDDANNNDGKTGGSGGGSFIDSRMVRVPRHMLGLNTYYKIPNNNFSLNLQTIGSSRARDYGNFNSPKYGSNYLDVQLDAYIVNHLTVNAEYIPGYDVFFKVTNMFNETYNTALDYSQPQRSFNVGFRRSFD